MSTWVNQDLLQRLKAYFSFRVMAIYGIRNLLTASLPTWLGGSGRPENMSAKDYAFGQLFVKFGSGFKQYETENTAVPELVASAYGIVLEIGPATGNQLDRFDKSKIEHIYGVEPNPAFVSPLLATVKETGLQEKYSIILGVVEDEELLAQHGIKENSVDSIVCLQTLCSVNDPKQAAQWMFKLLKPGGVFIFWEHQRSYDSLTRIVQAIWNPFWSTGMAGCNLNRPIRDIVYKAGDWDFEASELKEVNDPKLCGWMLPRVQGRMIKRA